MSFSKKSWVGKLTVLSLCIPGFAMGGTYTVTSSADTNTLGTLRYAINEANLNPDSTIQIAPSVVAPIILTATLPPIQANMAITGLTSGTTIDGASLYQPFVVVSGTVSLSNLTVQNGLSEGGAGGAVGGGGAMGAGGGLFVAPLASVSISNVNFSNCNAVGGAGGSGVASDISGGGGGGGFDHAQGGNGAVSPIKLSGGGGGGGGGYGPDGTGGAGGGGDQSSLIGGGGGGGGGKNFPGGDGGTTNSATIQLGAGGGGGGSDASGGGGGSASGTGGRGGNGINGSGGTGKATPSGNGGGAGGSGGQNGVTASNAGGNSKIGGGGGGGAGGNLPGGNGGNGTDMFGGGGGGGSGAGTTAKSGGGNGGKGGVFGGGGGGGTGTPGGSTNNGGAGGYGGGGGGGGEINPNNLLSVPVGSGGSGGFGGGGGASSNNLNNSHPPPGISVFGGGSGGNGAGTATAGGGGGGAGLGGAVFVGQGATLTLSGTSSLTGNGVAGGLGGASGGGSATAGQKGQALGKEFFIASRGTLIFSNGSFTVGSDIVSNQGVNTPLDSTTVGGVVVTDSATVMFTGNNSYTGSTVVTGNASQLAVSSDGGLGSLAGGSGLVSLSNGGTLVLPAVATSPNRPVVLGALGGGGVVSVPSGTSQIAGNVAGPGSLTKKGSGNLILSNANSYQGGTTITSGAVQIQDDANLGAPNRPVTLAGGRLEILTGGSISSSRPVVLSGPGGSIVAQTGGGTVRFDGHFSGNGTLTKEGTDRLSLGHGGNSHVGGTHLKKGTLSIASDGALGAPSGMLTFNGGTLEVTGSTVSSRPVTLSTKAPLEIQEGLTVLNGLMSGPGQLVKNGVGSLQLTNPYNNNSGGTQINAGNLLINNDGALGYPTALLIFKGGTLEIPAGANVVSERTIIFLSPGIFQTDAGSGASLLAGPISGVGPLMKTGADTLSLTGFNTYTNGTLVNEGTLQVFNDLNLGTFAGGIQLVDGATFEIIPGGQLVTGRTLTLTHGGTLKTSTPAAVVNSFDGLVTGEGPLIKTGKGTLALTRLSNNYTGGTDLVEGALQVADDAVLGEGDICFAGGTLKIAADGFATARPMVLKGLGTLHVDGGTAAVAGLIEGEGGLIKSGPGILALNNRFNDNTYTGGFTLHQGKVTLFNDNALGDPSGLLTVNSGTVELLQGATLSRNMLLNSEAIFQIEAAPALFSGTIDGPGVLIKIGKEALELSGKNGYASTVVQEGTLQISKDANLGRVCGALELDGTTLEVLPEASVKSNRTVKLLFGGTFQVDPGASATFQGPITGMGPLIKTGPGALALLGLNGYSGGTAVNEGILQINADANLGYLGGALTLSDAALEILPGSFEETKRNVHLIGKGTIQTDAGSGTAIFKGTISGTGSLVKSGPDTLVLSGFNRYEGSTQLDQGVLKIKQEENLGVGDVVFNGGALHLSDSIHFSLDRRFHVQTSGTVITAPYSYNVIASGMDGEGRLTLEGNGTLVLSGSNTYTGGTTVKGGTLELNGSLTDRAVVCEGATLTGIGSLGHLELHGRFYPGSRSDPHGTLTVASASFEPGSIFSVVTRGNLSNNLVSAGAVAIGEDTTLHFIPVNSTSSQYTIIESGSLQGEFARVVNSFPRYAVSVVYSETDAVVDIASVPFADIVTADPLHAIALCWDSMPPCSDYETVVNTMNALSFPEMVDAFTQMDPSYLNGVPLAQEALTEKIRQIFTARYLQKTPATCFRNRASWWLDFFIDNNVQKSVRNLSGYKDKFKGVVTGLDYLLRDGLQLSCGFAYARSLLHFREIRSQVGFDSYNGTLSLGWIPGPLSIDLSLGYTYHSTDSMRSIFIKPSDLIPYPITAVHRIVRGSSHSHTGLAHLGFAYDIPAFNYFLRPFLDLDYFSLFEGALKERDGGALNERIRSRYSDAFRPEVGLTLGTAYSICSSWILFSNASFSYVNETRFQGRNLTGSFEQNPDCYFRLKGLFPQRNLLGVAAQIKLATSDRFNFSAVYKGYFGSHYIENSGNVELELYW